MTRRAMVVVLMLPLMLSGPVRQPAAQAPVAEAIRTRLLALEKRWDDAIASKDIATLEGVLDPEFLFIDVDGSVTTRAGMLATIRSPKLVIEPFLTRDVQVRVFGRTAVLTGWFEQNGSYDGRRFSLRQRRDGATAGSTDAAATVWTDPLECAGQSSMGGEPMPSMATARDGRTGNSFRLAAVTTPSVPSAPIRNCFRS